MKSYPFQTIQQYVKWRREWRRAGHVAFAVIIGYCVVMLVAGVMQVAAR